MNTRLIIPVASKASNRQQETVGQWDRHRECRETLASASSLSQQHAQHHLLSPSSMSGNCEACARRGDHRKMSTCNITSSKNTSGEISPDRWSPAQRLAQLVSTESTASDQQPWTITQASGACAASVPRKSDPHPPYARLTDAAQAELPEARQADASTPRNRTTKQRDG